MVDEDIKTSVDGLIEFLKKIDKIELEEAAKKLDIPIETMQTWVDFLVEEKIIGIEYKFTTPYIYLNEIKKAEEQVIDELNIDKFKESFKNKVNDKKISNMKAEDLWKNHLLQKVEKKKEFFFKIARQKGFFNQEELWIEYKKKIMQM